MAPDETLPLKTKARDLRSRRIAASDPRNTITRSVRFPIAVDADVVKLAKSQQRDLSLQIRWMCIEYLRLVKEGVIKIPHV